MRTSCTHRINRRAVLASLAATGIAGCLDKLTTRDEPKFTSGEAYWEPGSDDILADSWPLARHDAQRSGTNSMAKGPEPPIEPKWSISPGETRFNTPVVADNRVFITNMEGGTLLALDVETGETLWKETFEQWLSAPAVADGVLYVKDAATSIDHEPNQVLAFDAATGQRKWTYELADDEHRGTTLVVTGGVVYVAADRYLLALDATTGKLAWRFDSGDPHRRLFSVVVGHELVYASAHTSNVVNEEERAGTVFALNPVTKTVEWSVDFHQASEVSLAEDTVLVRDLATLFALDRDTGEQRWQTPLRPHHTWERYGPDPLFAVVDDAVYYQAESDKTDGGVAIKGVSVTEGVERAHFELGYPEAIERSPLISVADTYLYTVTTENIHSHYIDVLDLKAKEHLQTIKLDHDYFKGYAGAPVIAENTLFVSDGGGGSVIAYQ